MRKRFRIINRQPAIMEFFNFIRSLFGAGRVSRSEQVDWERNKKATYGGSRFNLDEWVRKQKATFGPREGLAENLERRAAQFNGELLGLSGTLLDNLIYQRPRLIPKDFWGSDLGWRSVKRKKRWESLLNRNGVMASNTNPGLLIRFYIDASEWVPHPYAPPHWATSDFNVFSQHVVPSEEAFKLCVQWRIENSIALTRQLAERIRRFPVQIGASYRCHEHTDYADVAFLLLGGGTELFQVKTVWKGEAVLVELVKSIFPDASREYSPSWLMGQRIDVFIPSLQVALEYHGEQHYEPVDYFGGKKGLLRTKKRDQRKAKTCKDAGIILIEWKYTEPINESNLRKKLKAIGIEGSAER